MLKDIYYSIEKIESFKQRCIEKEDGVHRKVSDVVARLKDIKQSIKEVKAERQTKNKSVKDKINHVFNSKVNRIKDEAFARLESIHKRRLC